jgi:MarR family transcriptional regulator, lower aerobic nicotinate degradation pathway regulator
MTARAKDLDLLDGLFQLSFRLQATLARIAAAHDLSPVQVRLLGILRDREPGMLELARYLELEKSSLTGLVDRAEKRGLVERVPSPDDGRAITIRVTAPGRKLSRVIEDEATAEVMTLVGVLSRADRDRLSALLGQIVAAAGARSPGHPQSGGQS